ncbi:MAG: DUF3566 domain-containing protein [Bacillota bacterium]
MKLYEIQRIGPGSVFKLYFVLGVVIGLIISLVLVSVGATLNGIGYQLGTVNMTGGGPLQIAAVILGVIIGSLIYGLLSGVTGVIGAVVYNAFTALVGGIVIRLREKE